ncbi:hypothetical protein QBC37DRAFT_298299, partial [Rhypophila decipiens]
SIGEIIERRSGETCPKRGVAILIERALRQSPIKIPPGLIELEKAIAESKFLRVSMHEEMERMPTVRLEKDGVALEDEGGIEVFYSPDSKTHEIIRAAEQLTRAKLFRALRPEASERLQHDLQLSFYTVGGNPRAISSSGETHVSEGEKACVRLDNKGERPLYVNIFDVDVMGGITLVSEGNPGGMEIKGQSCYVFGQNRLGEDEGEKLGWPEGLTVCEAIGESLVFIVTENHTDLGHVGSNGQMRSGQTPKSTLEDLTFQIACGGARSYGKVKQATPILFDVIEIPFTMHPQTRTGKNVPDVDESAAKGFFGAGLRASQGVPSRIWVTNEHTEQITVVVSKLRPSRLWTGFGLNASATGGGITLSMETYAGPTTKKTLGPYKNGQRPVTGTFPLWNRREGFAVVSIYLGSEERCFIMNDQVPIGATAVFNGQPDMELIKYQGLER